MKNRMCVSFRMFFTENDLDLLLKDIDWKPEKIWRSGQPKLSGQCKLRHQDSGLSIDVDNDACSDLEEPLDQLMKKINMNAASIKKIIDKYKPAVLLSCVIYTDKQSFPSILVSNVFLKFFVDFQASIDIDIY